MNTNRIKLYALMLFVVPLLAVTIFKVAPAMTVASSTDDPATTFKAKCAVCHTPKAEKFYDLAKTDEEHVQIILKGKKGEKPPYMPSFEAKGMTEDEAKALNTYMKSLRTAAN